MPSEWSPSQSPSREPLILLQYLPCFSATICGLQALNITKQYLKKCEDGVFLANEARKGNQK